MRNLLIFNILLVLGTFTCSSQETHRVMLKMSVEECVAQNEIQQFIIEANPITTELGIVSKISQFTVALYDTNSRMVYQKDFEETQIKIDCSNMSSGIYYVVISTIDHSESYRVIIK